MAVVCLNWDHSYSGCGFVFTDGIPWPAPGSEIYPYGIPHNINSEQAQGCTKQQVTQDPMAYLIQHHSGWQPDKILKKPLKGTDEMLAWRCTSRGWGTVLQDELTDKRWYLVSNCCTDLESKGWKQGWPRSLSSSNPRFVLIISVSLGLANIEVLAEGVGKASTVQHQSHGAPPITCAPYAIRPAGTAEFPGWPGYLVLVIEKGRVTTTQGRKKSIWKPEGSLGPF